MSGSPQERSDPDRIARIAQGEAYQRLVARRRGFTIVAAALFYGLLGTFAVLAAWAHDFMGTRIASGLTVGYLAALCVFVGVWATVFAYARVSVRVLDPLAEDAQEEGGR